MIRPHASLTETIMNALSAARSFIACHRAALGIAAPVAAILLLALPDPAGSPWEGAALILAGAAAAIVFVIGACAVLLSPYVSILYREAPLHRLTGRPSELDEWELALRGRANSLAYPILLATSLFLLTGIGLLPSTGWFGVEGDFVLDIVFPAGAVGLALSVVLLEWIEPSAGLDRPEDGLVSGE